jgi:hypothetical protein
MKEYPHRNKKKEKRKRQSVRYKKLSEHSSIHEISCHIKHTERKSNEYLSFGPQKQKGKKK